MEINIFKKLLIDCLLYIIKAIVFIYSLITQPIFYFKYEVYKKRKEIETPRSLQINPNDPNSPWRQTNIDPSHRIIEDEIDSFNLYDEMMASRIKSFKKLPCYGYRKVLHEQWIKRPETDKLLRQVQLSDYNWVTYEQFEKQIEAARVGFLLQGIRPDDKVIIYADTRPEWQISAMALIRIGAIIVTMYSTLGVDGIVHCVNETQVTHIVTQKDKVNKLLRLKTKLPKLAKIIYFAPTVDIPEIEKITTSNKITANGIQKNKHKKENEAKSFGGDGQKENGIIDRQEKEEETWEKDFEHPQVDCKSFNEIIMKYNACNNNQELEVLDKEVKKLAAKRTRDSIAVIMYTSGSTGIPKGVLVTHKNIMSTVKSFSYVTKEFVTKPLENVCTAYLPLAHVFEFCIQAVMIYHGVKFGFATPHTLTDKSPGLCPGQTGDLTLLKPTVMIIVPLILDRIMQGVKQALEAQSYFKEQLVTFLIKYKIYWQKRFYETPIVDKIVCSKIAQALGGRAKYVICGSAPLSSETQSFCRAALNVKLPQGFGTTETCASTTCQLFDDQTTDNVGIPNIGVYIRLEAWPEGNYWPTDKPRPRGELLVGGEGVSAGYYNLEEQTKEAFFTDSNGIRWYRTGDIGEMLTNGNVRIIDRKKDLVKLQNGEYISLGKVESTFKSNPYTDNFCVYANSQHNHIVALAPANEASIKGLAQELVESHLRKSPSMMSVNRISQSASSSSLNDPVLYSSEQSRFLTLNEKEQSDAIEELKEILDSYESDKNNNTEQQHTERKMSSLSTNSATGGSINEKLESLCKNKLIQQKIMSHIRSVAYERGLMSLEIPKKVLLLAEEWTEDKNLVTAAMKIRRNYIYKRYEKELEQLYSN